MGFTRAKSCSPLGNTTCPSAYGGHGASLKCCQAKCKCSVVSLKLVILSAIYNLQSDRSPRLVGDREPCLRRLPTGSQVLLCEQKVHWRLLWCQPYGKHTRQNPGTHYCGGERRAHHTDVNIYTDKIPELISKEKVWGQSCHVQPRITTIFLKDYRVLITLTEEDLGMFLIKFAAKHSRWMLIWRNMAAMEVDPHQYLFLLRT